MSDNDKVVSQSLKSVDYLKSESQSLTDGSYLVWTKPEHDCNDKNPGTLTLEEAQKAVVVGTPIYGEYGAYRPPVGHVTGWRIDDKGNLWATLKKI